MTRLDDDLLQALAEGRHWNPHTLLGAHPEEETPVVRVRRPLADTVAVVDAAGTSIPLEHVGYGIWEGAAPTGAYRVTATYGDSVWEADDPYRFLPTVGQVDEHLITEGRHERLWDVLGAHLTTLDGVDGCAFAVWAPNARAVRVIGDWNGWDGAGNAMRALGSSGIWEIFIPEAAEGQRYKFHILTPDNDWIEKADPLARYSETAPLTASVIGTSRYTWGDDAWLADRAATPSHERPMSVYELHLGSWRPGLGYREAADELIPYITELGFTHVEFLPLAEHPYAPSWGYQVTGYYAATSRFGHPDDLKYLIDRLHEAGIGVILDWVPGHFPKDSFALGRFDGRAVYESADPRRGEQRDWGTYVFDFGRPEVKNFLVANALFWFEEFHVDGLRVDAVASMLYLDYSRKEGDWLPNVHGGRENLDAIAMLQEVNATAYKLYPGITMIAEESTSWPGVTHPTDHGGLGFGFKWNMGWMHDSLDFMAVDPIWRRQHNHEITFSLHYAFSENFVLPISHDEVVHGKGSLFGKMPGDHWQKLAGVRQYLAFMWAHPGKQLLFMGQEFAQIEEWSDERGVDWWLMEHPPHAQVARLVADLGRLYKDTPALWRRDHTPDGFAWVEGGGDTDLLAFVRAAPDADPVVCVFNFGGAPVTDFRLGLPREGEWREVVNTDAGEYGGSGVGNFGAVRADRGAWAGQPASATVDVPPFGAIYLAPAN